MKKLILILIISLFSMSQSFACDCECVGDCTFSSISNSSEFVALVKIISFDAFLEDDILGCDGKMPYAMTVEIVEKFKGEETRIRIKIWGDNGVLCRPYLNLFEIGGHYLIAPKQLGDYKLPGESATDYHFYSCNTDYLKVNLSQNKALGEYSKEQSEIDLAIFEKKLEK